MTSRHRLPSVCTSHTAASTLPEGHGRHAGAPAPQHAGPAGLSACGLAGGGGAVQQAMGHAQGGRLPGTVPHPGPRGWAPPVQPGLHPAGRPGAARSAGPCDTCCLRVRAQLVRPCVRPPTSPRPGRGQAAFFQPGPDPASCPGGYLDSLQVTVLRQEAHITGLQLGSQSRGSGMDGAASRTLACASCACCQLMELLSVRLRALPAGRQPRARLLTRSCSH